MNDTLKTEIKEAIVRSLRLPMKPHEIGDSVPLFGEGLDSIRLTCSNWCSKSNASSAPRSPTRTRAKRVLDSVNTIRGVHHRAAAREMDVITRPRPIDPGAPAPVTNDFTVDVEERFDVCGVDALSLADWDRPPSRVQLTTRRLLHLLDSAGVRATFFVVGWLAEPHPEVVRRSRRPDTSSYSMGITNGALNQLIPGEFPADLLRSRQALRTAGAEDVTMFRAPGWSSASARCGPSTCSAKSVRHRRQHGAARALGSTTYPRGPHLRQTRGEIVEARPLVWTALARSCRPGRGWGLRIALGRGCAG